MNDCIHFDKELGACKKRSDWSEAMPILEPCLEGPCGDYSNLKPCPFCGGKAKLETCLEREYNSLIDYYFIRCTSCGCRTGTYPPEYMHEAAERWNRRAEDA